MAMNEVAMIARSVRERVAVAELGKRWISEAAKA
jgi:hypothetical protein